MAAAAAAAVAVDRMRARAGSSGNARVTVWVPTQATSHQPASRDTSDRATAYCMAACGLQHHATPPACGGCSFAAYCRSSRRELQAEGRIYSGLKAWPLRGSEALPSTPLIMSEVLTEF